MSSNSEDDSIAQCDFTSDDLEVCVDDMELDIDADCSRPVWSNAKENRCVWHSQKDDKPSEELNKTVGDGSLAGAIAPGMDLRGIEFPEGSTFVGADFSGADLSEQVLSDIDPDEIGSNETCSTVLNHANLSGVNFQDSNLSGVFCENVNLKGADLFNADLPNAVLSESDLRHTDLFLTDLSGAVLTGTDLRKARLRGTDLSGVGLNQQTRIKGLVRGLCTRADSPEEWDDIAQGYHDLKQQFSNNGLSNKARKTFTLERRARAREALSAGGLGIVTFLTSIVSRILTGYGTRASFVLFWSTILAGGCAVIYSHFGSTRPIYYSVVTFTTSPPWRPFLFASDGLRWLRYVVLFETYTGTALTVLLGYVLGNRARY